MAYEAPFAEIWEDKTYIEAGLPPRKIPHVAFVDPDDHSVVYFFHGSKLFGLDVRKRKVVAYDESYFVGGGQEHILHRPIVDAWELAPPTLTPMEHVFPRGTHVRLRVTEFLGINGFVEARDNGRDVVLGAWGTMPHSAWVIDYIERQGKPRMLLQSSAYGRYLAHNGVLDGRTVSATGIMVDYLHPDQEELLWEVQMQQGSTDVTCLINAKYGMWDVSSEPDTTVEWRLDAILSTPTPPRPRPPPFKPPEYHGQRTIVLFQANDSGEFKEGYGAAEERRGDAFLFYGSSLLKLRAHVEQHQEVLVELGLPGRRLPQGDNSLCVQAGPYGRLTPLFTDLPHSAEPMDIVVLTNGSPAADALRYSSLEEA